MVEKLEIRQLELSDEGAFERYFAKWENEPIVNYHVRRFSDLESFADYLTAFEREKTESNSYSGSTSTKYFSFLENGEIAGSIDCRWEIEKGDLLMTGGHIGYMVAPDCRRQGVASALLDFALGKYLETGIFRVMISALETNGASRAVIEKFGGVLENIVDEDGENLCRYWIEL
ncbi:GNAT family N-acetyltransferase [Lactococcus nasutitermitis]|uniref:GNAT family N-acetyltransferase n=1 Tax=Lactococcus nasutitermitis TaxID=1652957 RepID=A0ABV9JFD5_9LACT|nr:GNAT family N-acetyltransferase [Lactococcus nasutitermitis]